MASARLLREFAVTAELTGATFSEAAKRAFVARLDAYPEEQALAALMRCQVECRYRLTLADVISRLDDGRPGPESAWSQVQAPETATLVWTDEMRVAYGAAAPLLAAGDEVAARMAFLEVYRGELARARAEGRPVNWQASLGHDAAQRQPVVTGAVAAGLLGHDAAQQLPPPDGDVDEAGRERVQTLVAEARQALSAGAERAARERAERLERETAQRREFAAKLAEARAQLLTEARAHYEHMDEEASD